MKSYTDIEQSKKLAKILPIESADMFWIHVEEKSPKIDFWKVETIQRNFKPYSMNVPCWSLAALLDILDNWAYSIDEDASVFLSSYKTIEWDLSIDNSGLNMVTKSDPVDACVEMITKLKEKDLL